MGDSKIKTYKAEVKVEVEENDDKPVTVKDFIELLNNIDQDAVLCIIPDCDYTEENSLITFKELKENIRVLKKEYPFLNKKSLEENKVEDKMPKNFLVIDAFNFSSW